MKRGKNRAVLLLLSLCAAVLLSGCQREEEPERIVLTLETFSEGSHMDLAGKTAASIINNTVPGVHVQTFASKGSPVNAKNVSEGSIDLGMVAGNTAWDAYCGEGVFEGTPMENLRVLAACYPILSQWTAGRESGLLWVHELEGKTVMTGSEASATDRASETVFSAIGLEKQALTREKRGLEESAKWIKEGWADAAHSFCEVPNETALRLSDEAEITFLAYTEEELSAILSSAPFFIRGEIPAGTYKGQEESVPTFGIQMLLCASSQMEEELAYEIAMAMDVNGAVYAGGHAFMGAMLDARFLCRDLPIPLHEGAERYYREQGYIQERKDQ